MPTIFWSMYYTQSVIYIPPKMYASIAHDQAKDSVVAANPRL